MKHPELVVNFNICLPIGIKKEGRYYISYCPPLDLFSQGGSEKKAKENITEAIQLFLESCFKRGTLDKVLKDCGFRSAHGEKERIPSGYIPLNVPLPFQINMPKQCHV